MPDEGSGLSFCMDQEIKNYIILIALDNLVNTYKDALDLMQLTQEEKDFLNQVIHAAEELKSEMLNPKISKPIWKEKT